VTRSRERPAHAVTRTKTAPMPSLLLPETSKQNWWNSQAHAAVANYRCHCQSPQWLFCHDRTPSFYDSMHQAARRNSSTSCWILPLLLFLFLLCDRIYAIIIVYIQKGAPSIIKEVLSPAFKVSHPTGLNSILNDLRVFPALTMLSLRHEAWHFELESARLWSSDQLYAWLEKSFIPKCYRELGLRQPHGKGTVHDGMMNDIMDKSEWDCKVLSRRVYCSEVEGGSAGKE
jgi:hypothetical protein